MRILPILFSGSMVRAILREIEQPGAGKTQTRRALPDQPIDGARFHGFEKDGRALFVKGCAYGKYRIRYAVGDLLWVRESWRADRGYDAYPPRELSHWPVHYEADGVPDAHDEMGMNGRLRPSMFMPRWASRITLIVTDVRVERLQSISEADAIAEGVETERCCGVPTDQCGTHLGGCCGQPEAIYPIDAYCDLWDSLNAKREGGKYAWAANPWVAAYSFRPILGNVDQIEHDVGQLDTAASDIRIGAP